jgi:TonB family protein
MSFWAMVKVCVEPGGNVKEAKIVKGADALLDPEILSKVRTWRYKPYMVNGRPVPFCYMLRYVISSQL